MHKLSAIWIAVVAALSATPALADNVTLSGIVDGSVAYVHSQENGGKDVVLSNGNKKSRVVVSGKEDLGDGLEASINLQQSIDVDGTKRALFDRVALVCLKSVWGAACIGRNETPTFAAMDRGTTGIESTLVSALGSGTSVMSRVQGGVEYSTPATLGGFYGRVQLGAREAATVGTNTYRGARIGYANKMTDISIAGGEAEMSDGRGDYRHWSFWADHNFGPAQVTGRYFNSTYRDREQDGLIANLAIPQGDFKWKAQIGKSKMKGTSKVAGFRDGDKSTLIGVGGEYKLSQRTLVYTRYSRVKNQGGTQTMAGESGNELNGVLVGMTHNF